MAAAEDDVPPLEDCSAELEKLGFADQPQKNQQPKREFLELKEDNSASCFKKGFLLGNTAKSSTQPAASKKSANSNTQQNTDGRLELTANPDADKEKLVFDEVQSAMQQNASFLNQQQSKWLNDDLLKKVEGNSFLLRMMAHPGIGEVLAEFQRNPREAVLKYQNNAEISRFFTEFTSILGSHFEQIGDVNGSEDNNKLTSSTQAIKGASTGSQKSDKALISEVNTVRKANQKESNSNEDEVERKVRDALSTPEVIEALSDSRVQKLIEKLRTSPDQGNSLWREADSETRRKLQVLIQHGVLGVQK